MLDHDTDSYYKISRAFVDGEPAGNLTRDAHPRQHHAVLADGHRAPRPPGRTGRTDEHRRCGRGRRRRRRLVPVAFTTFPGEIFAAPRSWAEAVYPNLIYFNEVDRGGHFAAWEEPELFSAEVRAAFRSLR